jgi:cell division protein FtsI (penicillin-binding protein 3)
MIKTRRLWMTSFCSLSAFVLIVMRLGYLQLYCHASLSERADREHSRHIIQQASRGAILDRNGGMLAESIQGGACYADPATVEKADETAQLLAPLVNLSAAAIRAKLAEHRRFVWIARRLDPETAQKIQDLHRPGISVLSEMKRFYPEESLGSQVLGIVNDEQEGLSGVELIANSWLIGKKMPFIFRQWPMAEKYQDATLAKEDLPAQSVVLTIDKTLQYIVEQELAVQMSISKPKSGTVIIQDPSTGEILAMASAPTFNPNQWGMSGNDGGPETLKNPAVEKVFEPGSTFKLVTAAAALEEKVVTPDDGFDCENGFWQIQGRKIHDHEKEGWLTFRQIISHSSNIGTAKVALRLGQSNLYGFARAFGFGIPSGVGLPGDGTGILRTPSKWRAGSLMTIAFGQEVGVTPLQMVDAYSVVANGGTLLEPVLFKGIVNDRGEYKAFQRHPPIRRVISPRTVTVLREILQEVVENGTGEEARVSGLTVAGKTGTAQKIDPRTHQYSPDHYIASFCGFTPVEKPRLVIGVFLDEPSNSYWGGSEAAPLFSRIVRDAASYLHLDTSLIGPLVTSRMASHVE